MTKDEFMYNHHPLQQNQWFVYNGWRFKVKYDIELYDGTIHIGLRPNGYAWLSTDGEGLRFSDEEVKRIRFTSPKVMSEFSRWQDCQWSKSQAFYVDVDLIPRVTMDLKGLHFTPRLRPER